MNNFVDECRQEWRRLGVPDPIANEMAADLTADLEEAEAEGGSPEDVLGNSAFDPRRFAAAWAVARGVTAPPPDRRPFWRPPVAIALSVLLGAVTVGAGLILLIGYHSRSFAFAVRRVAVAAPGSFFVPGPGRVGPQGPFGPPFAGTHVDGLAIHPLALALLLVGVVGLGLIAFLYWSRSSGSRRGRLASRRNPTLN